MFIKQKNYIKDIIILFSDYYINIKFYRKDIYLLVF